MALDVGQQATGREQEMCVNLQCGAYSSIIYLFLIRAVRAKQHQRWGIHFFCIIITYLKLEKDASFVFQIPINKKS